MKNDHITALKLQATVLELLIEMLDNGTLKVEQQDA